MNNEDRDELLFRVDERLKAIKDGDEGAIPEILDHLYKINDRVADVENDVKWIKRIGVGAVGLLTAVAGVIKFTWR